VNAQTVARVIQLTFFVSCELTKLARGFVPGKVSQLSLPFGAIVRAPLEGTLLGLPANIRPEPIVIKHF
jgi:hypothetical protein